MITLSLLRVRLGEEEFVMRDSPLSHTAAGVLSPPAPASAVDEHRCHSSRPHISISCPLLLTATDRHAAHPVCSPEHNVLLFFK